MSKMKLHLKSAGHDVTNIISQETGEVIDFVVDNRQYLAGDDGTFYLVWTECLNILENWELSISDLQMYTYLIRCNADGREFSITKSMKDELAKANKKSATTYNNCTRALVAKKLIVPITARSYKLNPRYVWKGSTTSRKQALFSILRNECPEC